VYDCSKVFIPEENPYRRETPTFNGKLERDQRPTIMKQTKWLRVYERDREKEFS